MAVRECLSEHFSACDAKPVVIESQLFEGVAGCGSEEFRQSLHANGAESIVTQVELDELGLSQAQPVAEVLEGNGYLVLHATGEHVLPQGSL